MGQYFKIVNPTKKQCIDAFKFDENIKASGVMYGYHGFAVALLVCRLDEVPHTYGDLAGFWHGDPVIAVGDDYGEPDVYGVKTSTEENPHRNLYWLAKEEYEDVSYANQE